MSYLVMKASLLNEVTVVLNVGAPVLLEKVTLPRANAARQKQVVIV